MSSSSEDHLSKSSQDSCGYTRLRPNRYNNDSSRNVYLVMSKKGSNRSQSFNNLLNSTNANNVSAPIRTEFCPNYDNLSFYDFPKSLSSDEELPTLKDNNFGKCSCLSKYLNYTDFVNNSSNKYSNLKPLNQRRFRSRYDSIKQKPKHKRVRPSIPLNYPIVNYIAYLFKWLWNIILRLLEISRNRLIVCVLLVALFIYYLRLLIFVLNCREVVVLAIF